MSQAGSTSSKIREPRPLGITIISLVVALSGALSIVSFTPLSVVVGIASVILGVALFKGIWWSRSGTMLLMLVAILLNFYQDSFTRQVIAGIVVQTITRGVVIFYLSQKGIKTYCINGSDKKNILP